PGVTRSIDAVSTYKVPYAKTGSRSSPMEKTNEPNADELAQRIQNRAAGRIGKLLADAQSELSGKEVGNLLWGNGVTEDGFVVAIDPEDMKNACQIGKEVRGAAMGHDVLKSVCGSDANPMAVWYRLRMLGLCDEAGLLSAHKHDGEFTDAVFRVAATSPIKRMEMDVTYQGPPFDTEEFVKQIERTRTDP